MKEIVYLSNQISPRLFQSPDWDTILACYPLSETKALKGVLMLYANGLGMLCVNLEAGGRPNWIGCTICECGVLCLAALGPIYLVFFVCTFKCESVFPLHCGFMCSLTYPCKSFMWKVSWNLHWAVVSTNLSISNTTPTTICKCGWQLKWSWMLSKLTVLFFFLLFFVLYCLPFPFFVLCSFSFLVLLYYRTNWCCFCANLLSRNTP